MCYITLMKTTPECISYVSNHPWLKKQFVKLSQNDILAIADFLDIPFLDKAESSKALDGLFMDKKEKPKKYLVISELISCCITYRFS